MKSEEALENRQKSESPPVRVWDLPLRVFHWALVAAVGVSITTGLSGGLWQMEWHIISGCVVLALVIFRIIWGVLGGRHARFVSFLKGPTAVARYTWDFVRRREKRSVGHNPLGGWSVVLIVTALALQAGTGLFSNDDIFVEGPLFDVVGKERSDRITGDHLTIIYVIYALIVMHITAIAIHWFRGDNLIKPMIDGHKTDVDEHIGDDKPRPVAFIVSVFLACGIVYAILNLAP